MCSDPTSRPPPAPRRGRLVEAARLTIRASDGVEVAARLARTGGEESPGVVVLPDFRGLHPYYEALADELAEAGVHALTIDHYSRTAGVGWRDADFDPMPHRERVTDAAVRSNVEGALAVLAEAGVGRRFVLGFCFGGRAALLQADRDDVAGVVVFYGRLSLDGDGGSPLALAREGLVRVPVLASFGGADPWIPVEDVAAFREACTAAGVPCDVTVYEGAPHSFFDHAWPDHAAASAEVWRRLLAFLRPHDDGRDEHS